MEYIFGIPGEENLDLLDSLKRSKIQLVLTRHEQAAGFMAATYGRLTGKPGVCLSTLGPGATNFVTSAAYAQLGGMPMIMLTGQKPIKKSKQGQFQIVDIVEMMKPITKWSKQIIHGNTIPSLIREAFRLAREERPGGICLELPEDIAAETTDTSILPPIKVRRPTADVKSVEQAVHMMQQAKRPLLLIGAGANRYTVSKMLLEFLKATGMYFFNTQMGKGVVDERHPLFLGTAALSNDDYIHRAIDHADLVINVGHDVIEKPPFFMEKDGKQVIHINYFSARVDDIYFPQLEIVGDIANALWQIKEKWTTVEATKKISSTWDKTYFERVKQAIEAHIVSPKSQATSFPMLPQRVVREVRKVMPEDSIITLDNGVYKIWFSRNYKAYFPNTVLLDNALATMGAGLPSAIAAKIVYSQTEKKVMAIVGDGGFMMNSQELETAIRLKLDLVVLILRDDAYGMIKWKQTAMGYDTYGLDFGNPDFVKYAESYGAKGYRVQKVDDFVPILQQALNSKGVHVIDLLIDYSENETILIKELSEHACEL